MFSFFMLHGDFGSIFPLFQEAHLLNKLTGTDANALDAVY